MVDCSLMATRMSANEATKALNDLLHYSPEDQDALLDVLDEYFTSPEDLEASDTLVTTGKAHIRIIAHRIIHTTLK